MESGESMNYPRPVKRVEISEQNKHLRLIAAILLLLIGAIGITVGIMNLLNQDRGWQRVQVYPEERNCSEQFILQYNFEGSGAEATAVSKKLQTVYGDACVRAYQLFTPDEEIAGVKNVWHLNRHPNEEITVDPVLYRAFEKLENTRYLYLGPVYSHYSQIIYNAEEGYVEELDPAVNADAAAWVKELATYAADPEMISLELLGDHRVMLRVSEEYLSFARDKEMEGNFIDFSYMTNAFVIDYLAQTLTEQNLTDGYLVSADGFTRNMTTGQKFLFNIFDRIGNTVYPAAAMEYEGPVSLVFLKDYPTADSDINYRAKEDSFIHLFADPVDGMYRTAAENLVSYSYEESCADVLLKMLPSFLGEEFSVPEGVFSVWCEEDKIFYNDEAIVLKDLLYCEEITYRAELKK